MLSTDTIADEHIDLLLEAFCEEYEILDAEDVPGFMGLPASRGGGGGGGGTHRDSTNANSSYQGTTRHGVAGVAGAGGSAAATVGPSTVAGAGRSRQRTESDSEGEEDNGDGGGRGNNADGGPTSYVRSLSGASGGGASAAGGLSGLSQLQMLSASGSFAATSHHSGHAWTPSAPSLAVSLLAQRSREAAVSWRYRETTAIPSRGNFGAAIDDRRGGVGAGGDDLHSLGFFDVQNHHRSGGGGGAAAEGNNTSTASGAADDSRGGAFAAAPQGAEEITPAGEQREEDSRSRSGDGGPGAVVESFTGDAESISDDRLDEHAESGAAAQSPPAIRPISAPAGGRRPVPLSALLDPNPRGEGAAGTPEPFAEGSAPRRVIAPGRAASGTRLGGGGTGGGGLAAGSPFFSAGGGGGGAIRAPPSFSRSFQGRAAIPGRPGLAALPQDEEDEEAGAGPAAAPGAAMSPTRLEALADFAMEQGALRADDPLASQELLAAAARASGLASPHTSRRVGSPLPRLLEPLEEHRSLSNGAGGAGDEGRRHRVQQELLLQDSGDLSGFLIQRPGNASSSSLAHVLLDGLSSRPASAQGRSRRGGGGQPPQPGGGSVSARWAVTRAVSLPSEAFEQRLAGADLGRGAMSASPPPSSGAAAGAAAGKGRSHQARRWVTSLDLHTRVANAFAAGGGAAADAPPAPRDVSSFERRHLRFLDAETTDPSGHPAHTHADPDTGGGLLQPPPPSRMRPAAGNATARAAQAQAHEATARLRYVVAAAAVADLPVQAPELLLTPQGELVSPSLLHSSSFMSSLRLSGGGGGDASSGGYHGDASGGFFGSSSGRAASSDDGAAGGTAAQQLQLPLLRAAFRLRSLWSPQSEQTFMQIYEAHRMAVLRSRAERPISSVLHWAADVGLLPRAAFSRGGTFFKFIHVARRPTDAPPPAAAREADCKLLAVSAPCPLTCRLLISPHRLCFFLASPQNRAKLVRTVQRVLRIKPQVPVRLGITVREQRGTGNHLACGGL